MSRFNPGYRTFRITKRWTHTFLQICPGGFYFRVAGWGLSFWKDRTPSFSARNGYKYVWTIGRWSIEVLYPW
jgi:hypothetical protein